MCVAGRLSSLPVCVDLELVGFADTLVGFRDALDWAERQHGTGFGLPPKTFASTWHTSLDEAPDRERPEATAWVAGAVQAVARHVNPLSQRPFYNLPVDVGEVQVDRVAPEELARTVEPGWLVQGSVWVLGRLPGLELPSDAP